MLISRKSHQHLCRGNKSSTCCHGYSKASEHFAEKGEEARFRWRECCFESQVEFQVGMTEPSLCHMPSWRGGVTLGVCGHSVWGVKFPWCSTAHQPESERADSMSHISLYLTRRGPCWGWKTKTRNDADRSLFLEEEKYSQNSKCGF